MVSVPADDEPIIVTREVAFELWPDLRRGYHGRRSDGDDRVYSREAKDVVLQFRLKALELARDQLAIRDEVSPPCSSEFRSDTVDGVAMVSIATAAERLGISDVAVRQQCRVGRLAAVAVRNERGHWQIPVTALPEEKTVA